MSSVQPVTEQEIQAISVAPRVTQKTIDALMKRVVYVTVEQPNDTTSTFVHAYLDGAFLLATGFSACVAKENFDAEMGKRMAMNNAVKLAENKLWELEGYHLYKSLKQAKPTIKPEYLFQGCLVKDEINCRVSNVDQEVIGVGKTQNDAVIDANLKLLGLGYEVIH
jgi:hypothetical protein